MSKVISGKLNIIERLKNSTMGNPRYSFVLVDSEGNELELIKTLPNSMYGYSLSNYENKEITVEVKMVRGSLSLINIVNK